jgi:hypothetical protein
MARCFDFSRPAADLDRLDGLGENSRFVARYQGIVLILTACRYFASLLVHNGCSSALKARALS